MSAPSPKKTTNDPDIQPAGARETSQEELWLRNFVSASGGKLENEQQSRLSKLFREWASGPNIDVLKQDALSWCKDPSSFCNTTSRRNNSELIGVYFDEYENSKGKAPRRFILAEIFRAVHKEEQQIRRSRKTKWRHSSKSPTPPPVSLLSETVLSLRSEAIKSIATRLWKGDKDFQRRKNQLTKMSRYGEKWSLIEPKGILLALGGKSQPFERQKWSKIEIEAINTYVKAMPIYSIQPTLEEAIEAITREWSRRLSTHQTAISHIATSDLKESANFQTDTSTTNSMNAGIQIILSSFMGKDGAMENGTSTSQGSKGIQSAATQLTTGSFLFEEDMVPLYQIGDFESVTSPFIDFEMGIVF